jgi:hypothetical protein
LSVGSTGSFTTTANYDQSAGNTEVDGALTAGGGSVHISGGTLSGSGTVTGNVTMDGTLSPGDSPGTLTINGNYMQSSSGVLMEQLGGTGLTMFDRTVISGTASLNGTLNISLVNGYVPVINDTFIFLTASGVSGSFSTVNGLGINDLMKFFLYYDPNDVRLVVGSTAATPEPAVFPLMTLALLLLIGARPKSTLRRR